LIERTNRSANAFKFGLLGGSLKGVTPLLFSKRLIIDLIDLCRFLGYAAGCCYSGCCYSGWG
jgi:hypothetical protein